MSREGERSQELVSVRSDEIDSSPKAGLPTSNRLLVFGSRMSGAFDLHDVLRAELDERGIAGVEVDVFRFVTNIDVGFFGRFRRDGDQPPALPSDTSPMPVQRGRGARLRHFLRLSPPEPTPVQEPPLPPDSVPLGVLVFSEMRFWDEVGHWNMDVGTPYAKIEDLCREHGVPLVYVSKDDETPHGLGQRVGELMQGARELPPAT